MKNYEKFGNNKDDNIKNKIESILKELRIDDEKYYKAEFEQFILDFQNDIKEKAQNFENIQIIKDIINNMDNAIKKANWFKYYPKTGLENKKKDEIKGLLIYIIQIDLEKEIKEKEDKMNKIEERIDKINLGIKKRREEVNNKDDLQDKFSQHIDISSKLQKLRDLQDQKEKLKKIKKRLEEVILFIKNLQSKN